MKWTAGEERADRIIQEEMLEVGDELRKARNYPDWEIAHLTLEALGEAVKRVHSKTPNLEASRARERTLFDVN